MERKIEDFIVFCCIMVSFWSTLYVILSQDFSPLRIFSIVSSCMLIHYITEKQKQQ